MFCPFSVALVGLAAAAAGILPLYWFIYKYRFYKVITNVIFINYLRQKFMGTVACSRHCYTLNIVGNNFFEIYKFQTLLQGSLYHASC